MLPSSPQKLKYQLKFQLKLHQQLNLIFFSFNEFESKDIRINIGPYGPYVNCDKTNVSVKDKNIFEAKDLAKYNVSAKVLEHSRDAKVTIIKKKRRKGYQRKRGHRQDLTLLQIQSISAAKTKKTAAKKPAAKKTESKK